MSQTTTTKRIDLSAPPFFGLGCSATSLTPGVWEITAPNMTQAQLEAAVASAPTAPEPATLDANRVTLRTEAREAFTGLRAIVNSSGTLTGAQLSNAVRLLAHCVIVRGRLHLDELDATG